MEHGIHLPWLSFLTLLLCLVSGAPLQSHDRDSLNAFKQAQESVAEGESTKDLGKILATKKSEAKPDSNKTKKLLSSMISVKGRER